MSAERVEEVNEVLLTDGNGRDSWVKEKAVEAILNQGRLGGYKEFSILVCESCGEYLQGMS